MSHAHAQSEGPSAESLALNHEVSDARAQPVIWGVVMVAGTMVLAFVLAMVLLVVWVGPVADQSNTLSNDEVTQLQLPPAPRLEQNPRVDGDRIIAEATERLESYGWVNERAGRAHIPIERAMELLLEHGLDAVK
ncbi:hypothetical protein A6A03_05005 [Chloroflexus islandicus]|uniref:Uncharacterized protein n=1 Tax=Chloroflexus islandicus TaxID=1707952 RepID=A0A178LWP5_9CHLR|nr:hypothetical protein [Chloroflexus islandicus]OAN38250.1 hypothetical protein A6A03_05005 [Chloroflexus islandicus]